MPNIDDHEVIMGGDWNCVLNRDLDCIGGNHGTKINTLAEISKIRSKFNLIDIFRTKHPYFRKYTWRRRTPAMSRSLFFNKQYPSG